MQVFLCTTVLSSSNSTVYLPSPLQLHRDQSIRLTAPPLLPSQGYHKDCSKHGPCPALLTASRPCP